MNKEELVRSWYIDSYAGDSLILLLVGILLGSYLKPLQGISVSLVLTVILAMLAGNSWRDKEFASIVNNSLKGGAEPNP